MTTPTGFLEHSASRAEQPGPTASSTGQWNSSYAAADLDATSRDSATGQLTVWPHEGII